MGPCRHGRGLVEDGSNGNVQKHVDITNTAAPTKSLNWGLREREGNEGVHLSALGCH